MFFNETSKFKRTLRPQRSALLLADFQSSREHKEITARSDVWDDYDKKLEKSKNVESKKTQSSEERLSKQQISAEAAPKKKVEEKTKQQTQATAETPFDYSEALKRPPPDVDLNDFVVRAAMAQTVVNPFLVKKIGNIDDEHADPKKLKEHIQQLDEQMKTKEATVEDRPEQAKVKGVKWGDAKSVLYETRDQLTLEDEAEDAGDLA
ncbi:hypothetical protein Y032_0118g776 [Ancylostoma ceylanicum]|uniref:Uncharacterized protein n=1 Tax=Ancylostoma ceylanicum TaxID=53326 RepID=A0A016TBP7_9BILA|nr:hypothetical protein Y032_0118g776 [Ancylostoma ceylanicum]